MKSDITSNYEHQSYKPTHIVASCSQTKQLNSHKRYGFWKLKIFVTSCNIHPAHCLGPQTLRRQQWKYFPPRQGGSGEGWSEHQTGDGRKFFHNEVWIDQTMAVALSGKNHLDFWQETGVSQWEKPDTLMSENEKIVNSGVPWIFPPKNGLHHFGAKNCMDVHITLQRIPGMEAIQVGLAAWNFQAPWFSFNCLQKYGEKSKIDLDRRKFTVVFKQKYKENESLQQECSPQIEFCYCDNS